MLSDSKTPAVDATAIAVRLKLLSPSDAEQLRAASEKDGVPPLQAALQTGLLSAETIDIVETLLRPQDSIPGYEMLDLLGRGGMGVVYRARQMNLQRIVALKTIRVGRMADLSVVARFELEARTIAQLQHPNIVSAFDFGRHGGRLYLAMEYVEGNSAESLSERQGPLPERMVWSMLRQAAAGLAHAWSRRIVHRDVKPANLLLVEKPEGFPLPPGIPLVMLADFGLAQLSDLVETGIRLTAENVTVGSPHYMAPEQLQSSDVDFRADMYSLGVTALHLLIGSAPLVSLTLPQLVARKLTETPLADEPQFRDRVSKGTHALLRRMTARTPTDRHSSYAELIDEIDLLLASAATSGTDGANWRSMSTVIFSTDAPAAQSVTTATAPVATAITKNSISTTSEPTTRSMSYPEPALPGSVADAMSTQMPFGRASRRRWLIPAAVILAAIGLALGLWSVVGGRFGARRETGVTQALTRVQVKESGLSEYLFNGTNLLANFKPISGNWVVPKDHAVIAGTDGCLAGFLIHRGPNNQPLPLQWYRLEALVELRSAKAARVGFAIAAPDASGIASGSCWGVQLQGNRAELVRRDDVNSPWEPTHPAITIDPAKQHLISIERNPGGWFVTLGETALGSIPLAETPDAPEFHLSAEGGPAWFSDLLVTELQPAS